MAELLQHRLFGLFSMSRHVLWPLMPHPIVNSMTHALLRPLPSSWLSLVSKPAASKQTTITEVDLRQLALTSAPERGIPALVY